MKPYPHQEVMSDLALEVLREHGIAYFASEERTGKTLAAILTAEKSGAKTVLVVTKKKAISGWEETLAAFKHDKHYFVVNYHMALKKYEGMVFDLVILDEAHNYISSYPKVGKIWKELNTLVASSPILYVSATPYAQGPQMLYHQLKLSAYNPWHKYKNFYRWFELFGKPYTKEINRIKVPQYDRADSELILASVEHIFITKTREELGFEHEPEDKLHYITLDSNVRSVYNTLVTDNIVHLSVGELVCDSKSKLRTSLHQLEGGTIRVDDKAYSLSNCEKINYIKEHFGDRADLVIMYNFRQEELKLKEAFSNALILQATSYAEGVDLHKYKDLIVYSQDYSTARHTQRRARQCNMNRKEAITIHFLLVTKGISEQVYKTVSVNKKNFVDSVFKRELL